MNCENESLWVPECASNRVSSFPTNTSLFSTTSIDGQDQRRSFQTSTHQPPFSSNTLPHNSTHISPSTPSERTERTESTVLTTQNPTSSCSHSVHANNCTRTEEPGDATHPSQTQSETWTTRSLPSIRQTHPSHPLANDQTESVADRSLSTPRNAKYSTSRRSTNYHPNPDEHTSFHSTLIPTNA